MEIKDFLEIMERFEGSDITKLRISSGEDSIDLEKAQTHLPTEKVSVPETIEEKQPEQEPKPEGIEVKAPLAGVFYSAPKPGAKDYVREGVRVRRGDTLGLVEAMKMMNEITAPTDGIIKKIYAKNEAYVQFNEVCMLIEE